jgi:hypothetical protein
MFSRHKWKLTHGYLRDSDGRYEYPLVKGYDVRCIRCGKSCNIPIILFRLFELNTKTQGKAAGRFLKDKDAEAMETVNVSFRE